MNRHAKTLQTLLDYHLRTAKDPAAEANAGPVREAATLLANTPPPVFLPDVHDTVALVEHLRRTYPGCDLVEAAAARLTDLQDSVDDLMRQVPEPFDD